MKRSRTLDKVKTHQVHLASIRTSSLLPGREHSPSQALPCGRCLKTLPRTQLGVSGRVCAEGGFGGRSDEEDWDWAAAAANSKSRWADMSQGVGSMALKEARDSMSELASRDDGEDDVDGD